MPPPMVMRGNRVFRQVFQQPARKIPHIQHRHIWQIIEFLHDFFAGRPGTSCHVIQAVRPRHIYTPMDRSDPCRTGKRAHDSGCSENRQPALDAQSRVPCFLRQCLPSGNGHGDFDIRALTQSLCHILYRGGHHLAGHRVDRRFSGRDGQPRHRHPADPIARAKNHPPCRSRYLRDDHHTMGHIRIVAPILDNPGLGPAIALSDMGDLELGSFPFRQSDPHFCRHPFAPKHHQRRPHGGGRAGARGPATAQFFRRCPAHPAADYRDAPCPRQLPFSHPSTATHVATGRCPGRLQPFPPRPFGA